MSTTKQKVYASAELVYAAYNRCPCGAGLAYPRDSGVHGHWDCAAILTGKAIPLGQEGSVEHTGELPFAFYEIKSENQPSANGATTRPDEDNTEEGLKAQEISKARADIANNSHVVADIARQQADLDEDKARWAGIRQAAVDTLKKHGLDG